MVLGVDGNDSLKGDRAQDTLTGGLGNDLLVLRQSAGTTDLAFADAIADFQVGFDAIAELTFLQSYSTCKVGAAAIIYVEDDKYCSPQRPRYKVLTFDNLTKIC